MTAPAAVLLRHKEYGSVYRIIRTTVAYLRGDIADLYWIVRGVNSDGTEHKSTSRISVDAWATGDWEVVAA